LSSGRIIRPAPDAIARAGVQDLNLQDLESAGRAIVQDARRRAEAAEARCREVDAEIARRKAGAEEEIAAHRRALEDELARLRADISAEVEKGRRQGWEEVRAQARAEGLAEGREQGFARGLAEGLENGRREGREAEVARIRAESAGLQALIEGFAAEFGRRRLELLDGARSDLLRLALRVAERIVGVELRRQPELVLAAVHRAISLVVHARKLRVQLHPEDLAMLRTHAPAVIEPFAGFGEVELVAAEDLARGGCRISTGSGLVDLSLPAQLQVIEERLLAAGRAEGPPESKTPVDELAEACA
jgi:flagellar assembly protein FliH